MEICGIKHSSEDLEERKTKAAVQHGSFECHECGCLWGQNGKSRISFMFGSKALMKGAIFADAAIFFCYHTDVF